MIRRQTILRAGVALMCLAGAQQAAAQEDQNANVLNPIVVEGGKTTSDGTGPVDGYVAKQTTTGSKADLPVSRIPQAVSVIGREELDDRAVVNKVDEALRYTPGVLSQPFGVDPDTDWVYIRGFDASQTGIFLDGLNLYSFGFGNFQIDPYFLERAEVLKGPASTLYGASNPGGILNMISKRPTGERLISTEAGINSDGNAYAAFDAGNSFENDAFAYRITGKIAGGDNYSDYSKDFRGAIMPQLTWKRDDTTKLTVYGYYSALDQVHVGNGFLPYWGTVKPTTFGRIDPKSYYGNPDTDDGTAKQGFIGYEFETELENGLKLSQNLRYGSLRKNEKFAYPFGYYDASAPEGFTSYLNTPGSVPALSRIGFEHQTEVDTFAVDNKASGEFDTGAVNHNLTVGLDYKYFRIDHRQASGFSTVTIDNPDLSTPIGALTPYLDQVLTQQQAGIYVQDQMKLGGWLLTANGRYDVVRTESDAKIGYSYDSTDRAFSGRIGLGYEFANGMTPYVSASTFFNPVIGASPTAPIKPEEGYQYEAGVKYAPDFIDGVFTVSAFQITKKNWTVTDPATFLQSQIGEVVSSGVEFEGKVNLNDSWRAIGSFSYNDLEMTKHADASLIGNSPYLIPKVTAAMWLDYKLPENWVDGISIGGGLRYKGWSWADYANTLKVPGALLADAGIRYEKNDLTVALNVTNLFDKRYVAGCQGVSTCGYGDTRTVMLKIGKSW
ncbi:TonB-dependent siderophore receptor [Rhizobium sp.]